jgi:hypothetical protein
MGVSRSSQRLLGHRKEPRRPPQRGEFDKWLCGTLHFEDG